MSLLFLDVLAHPVHALLKKKTIMIIFDDSYHNSLFLANLNARSLDSRARLDLPRAILQLDQANRLGDFRRLQHVRQVLLVGEHQKRHLIEFGVAQQLGQFVASFEQSLAVTAVDDVDLIMAQYFFFY